MILKAYFPPRNDSLHIYAQFMHKYTQTPTDYLIILNNYTNIKEDVQ